MLTKCYFYLFFKFMIEILQNVYFITIINACLVYKQKVKFILQQTMREI